MINGQTMDLLYEGASSITPRAWKNFSYGMVLLLTNLLNYNYCLYSFSSLSGIL